MNGGAGDHAIASASVWVCDLEAESPRHDAVQVFTHQETIFVEIETAAGAQGLGYAYTIGSGGGAVHSLLAEEMLPLLIGLDASRVEAIWQTLWRSAHALSGGVLFSLALAAIDTALWDLRCQEFGEPLWVVAGGARPAVPVYDTEGGWLQLSIDELVERAANAVANGFRGVKVKVGKSNGREDLARLTAVRDAIGPDRDLMIDANQAFTADEAIRRARLFDDLDLRWFEEPLPASDVLGHRRLAHCTPIPIAAGESLYTLAAFEQYLRLDAATIVQPDAARVGGVTPWLKIAHRAEAANVAVAPHFLMELHVSLAAAVPNAIFVEHIPQLSAIVSNRIDVRDGCATAPQQPGLGISWDRDALHARRRSQVLAGASERSRT